MQVGYDDTIVTLLPLLLFSALPPNFHRLLYCNIPRGRQADDDCDGDYSFIV